MSKRLMELYDSFSDLKRSSDFSYVFSRKIETVIPHRGNGSREEIREVHRRKGDLVKLAQSLIDKAEREKRDMTVQERNAFDVVMDMAEAANIILDTEKERRINITIPGVNDGPVYGRDAEGRNIPLLTKEHRFQDYAFKGGTPAGPDQLTAGEYLRGLVMGAGNNQELRVALSEGSDSAGGFSVPDMILGQIIDRMRAQTHVIGAGAITLPLNTERTSLVTIESDPQPAWRSENSLVTESAPTFGSLIFSAKSVAVLVKVSRELMEDSLNINTALETALTAAMAQELDRVCLYGAGGGVEPQGLVNNSNINVYSMGANGAQITNWTQLLASAQMLADANAADPTAAIMAPRTRFTLAGLVDTLGQPLRRPDLIEKLPLLQTSKVPTNETQGTATGVCSSIITGDFRQLFIGMRTAMRIEVLKERFADNLQYGFLCHMRMDVGVAQPKSFVVLKGIKP